MSNLAQQVSAHFQAGDHAGAWALLDARLQNDPLDKDALSLKWQMHFELGEMEKGLQTLRVMAASFTDDAELMHRHGVIEEQIGTPEKALKAHFLALNAMPNNPIAYLYAGYALEKMGRTEEAAQVYSLGTDVEDKIRHYHKDPNEDPNTRARSHACQKTISDTLSRLHRDTISDIETDDDLSRIAEAVWVQTHDQPFEFKHKNQRPWVFYVPGLKPITFAGDEDIPWAKGLDKHFDDIKAEFVEALPKVENVGHPYIADDMQLGNAFGHLIGSLNWTALDLFRDATPNSDIAPHFPKTIKALSETPIAKAGEHPIEAFFSVLKPGQIIPPHFGVANNRLTVHFPLIIPDGGKLRCADEWVYWKEGETIAFDDSFDHEAHNPSDEMRVVLIFETWHPDLTAAEIAAIEKSFEARNTWLAKRDVPTAF